MTAPLRVALLGFGDFEQHTLESYFRLNAAAHGPAFVATASLGDSEFCVADADRPAAVAAVQAAGRVARSVFIGQHLPEGALMHLERPIDPLHVARALEALLQAHGPTPPVDAVAPAATPAPSAPPEADPAFAGVDMPEVLVVDDSGIARRFLAVQLERLGCRVTEASSAEEALALHAAHRHPIVFSDVAMEGTDGLLLCRRLKETAGATPVVVLVSAHCSASDRVRGSLAGCDAYLAKPLLANELRTVLRAHAGAPALSRRA